MSAIDDMDLTPCFYCGLIADSIDHVPPHVARGEILSLGLVRRYPFVEVPSCRECNSALGARALWTPLARKHWIKSWLRRRYEKYQRIPKWSDSELMALGPILRGFVLAGLEKQRILQERLRW